MQTFILPATAHLFTLLNTKMLNPAKLTHSEVECTVVGGLGVKVWCIFMYSFLEGLQFQHRAEAVTLSWATIYDFLITSVFGLIHESDIKEERSDRLAATTCSAKQLT